MPSSEILKEAFNELSVDISNDLLDSCVVLCVKYSLDEESLAETWKAFSLKYNHECPTQELLDEMERRELNSSKTPKRQVTSSSMEVSNKAKVSSSRKPLSRPGNGSTASPTMPSTPLTPQAQLTHTKYIDRKNSGLTVWKYGKSEHEWTSSKSISVQITEWTKGCDKETLKWRGMWDSVRDLRYILDENSVQIAEKITKKHRLEEPVPFSHRCQDSNIFGGLVTKFNWEKSNNFNCIELQDLFDEEGTLMDVDVSETKYSLFPGQVVLFKGRSITGKELTATELYLSCSEPLPPPPDLLGHLQLIVAAGPFSLKPHLSFDPLSDLLAFVKKADPNVVILLGPLVDVNHPVVADGNLDKSVFDHYEKLVQEISQGVPERTTVCIISSYRDASNIPIYPTKANFLSTPQFQNVKFFPDPSLIDINGVIIGISSTDSILHLGKHEISNESTKKLHRLPSHLIKQQSFYPLYPADPEAPVDLKLRCKFAQLPVTPHVLIIPSDLHFFVSDIEDSLVINPERLVKGQAGGTFACVEIRPKDSIDEDAWSPATHISSKIVKV